MKKSITIVGLGAGDIEQMTLGTYRMLTEAKQLYVRTKSHPVLEALEMESVQFTALDYIYEKHQQFPDVYEDICETLLKEATSHQQIIYAVPGHPLVAEQTVKLLLTRAPEQDCEVHIAGGQSFLDPVFSALQIDPIEGFQLLDGTAFDEQQVELKLHVVIAQVYNEYVASEVKLALMEILPADYEIYVVAAAGSKQEQIKKIKLYELDREVTMNQLTSVYIPPIETEALSYHEFGTLRQVIQRLRGPGGCPWDQKQTHQSLKKYLVEETYEVLDAIDEQDDEHLIEELGDVLLQVMLHAQIGQDNGYFTIQDVIYAVTKKMIDRHPHVFGDVHAETAEDVSRNWEELKKKEQGNQDRQSRLDGIPSQLPNLYRALALQKKAAQVGFDWKEPDPIWDKVKEEWAEFKAEVASADFNKMESEFGDLLFALVNIARYYQIDPEAALQLTNRKFKNRFNYIEEHAQAPLEQMTLADLDHLWNEAKSIERQ